MSQARQMTIALNQHMGHLKKHVENMPLEEKVKVYLDVIRAHEHKIDGLYPAITNSCRTAILNLYGSGSSLTNLPYKVLTDLERAKCGSRRTSVTRAAFNKWLSGVHQPSR